ncbi:hypothetical protein KZZ07_13070 [Mameliella sp. CS4]|uniref:hypothetical protein n=1 Tax=Mameliella sp. CS4 TaxID=2862329 RepID=UPI001C5D3CF0|nr:hypothetical protein [Mameliella sp. CS4]MBW4983473.1 hypothetical protein [Mameliella sp. CS4]
MNMNYSEAIRGWAVVGPEGGSLSGISADGEVLWTVGIPAGKHSTGDYLDLLGPTDQLAAGPGVTLIPGVSRVARVRYGEGGAETGANPDFAPTRMTESEVQMRRLIAQVADRNDSLAKRLAQYERATTAPAQREIPQDDPAPVVEEPETAEPEVSAE